jgi:hypothetical protein
MSSKESEDKNKILSASDSASDVKESQLDTRGKVDFDIKSTEEEIDNEGMEEEDDDEFAEEAEPILAYTRMKNDVLTILEQDSVSCIKAGHRVNNLLHLNLYKIKAT